jgi:hypothetical protein
MITQNCEVEKGTNVSEDETVFSKEVRQLRIPAVVARRRLNC